MALPRGTDTCLPINTTNYPPCGLLAPLLEYASLWSSSCLCLSSFAPTAASPCNAPSPTMRGHFKDVDRVESFAFWLATLW